MDSYEKKYKDALARMELCIRTGLKITPEYIFPELKESEDEKIRKELISYFKQFDNEELRGVNISDWITWLEKQGKHANFRNKIQIGDKVTCNEDGVLVNLSQLERVAKKLEKQEEQKPEIKYVYTKFRIGDVIVEIKPNGSCRPVKVKYIGEGAYSCESDDGKRYLSFPIINQDEYKLVEQNPTWSEEDEYNFAFIQEALLGLDGDDSYREKCCKMAEWLESLKPQNRWRPSEAQIDAVKWYIDGNNQNGEARSDLRTLYNDLKKTKMIWEKQIIKPKGSFGLNTVQK